MQLLGMNAVRIPFSFLTLYNGVPGTFKGGCPTATYDQILAGLTPPFADPTAAANAASMLCPNLQTVICLLLHMLT